MLYSQKLNNILRIIPAWTLYPILFVPAFWMLYLGLSNQLGADPAKELELFLGEFALKLLVVVLLITPLRNLFNLNLVKFRRAIGLMAFYYVVMHLAVYLFLDQQLWWDAIVKDITKRPYIIVGVVALVGMIPLAATSNNWAIRRLGPIKWRKLHWMTYGIAILGAGHFVMLKKNWQVEPLVFLMIILMLVGYRVVKGVRGFATR